LHRNLLSHDSQRLKTRSHDYRTGSFIALLSKIQGSSGVTTEDFVPFGVGKI
jgi:hypothetical protein